MAEFLISNETIWECLMCGKCCEELSLDFSKGSPRLGEEPGACPLFSKGGLCKEYNSRPLLCRIYPFHPSRESMAFGLPDFSMGKLLGDSSCPGFGHGRLVFENASLVKELDKVSELIRSRKELISQGRVAEAFLR